MATEKTRTVEPREVIFTLDAMDSPKRIYTNNGIEIPSGAPVTLKSADLPREFPLTLGELANEAEKVEGMEVKRID